MKIFNTFKKFINYLGLNYASLYVYKNEKINVYRNILKKAKENMNNDIDFKCSEEKLLKVLYLFKEYSHGLFNKKTLEVFCRYLSEEDLKEISLKDLKEMYNKFEISLENLTAEKKKLIKNKKQCLATLLEALIINFIRIESILSDSELTMEKLLALPEDEFKYIVKYDTQLLDLLKKVPVEALRKIKSRVNGKEN